MVIYVVRVFNRQDTKDENRSINQPGKLISYSSISLFFLADLQK